MAFVLKTIIKNVDPEDVIQCFHSPEFIKFLTAGQPVKIHNWNGIDNNKKASFSFWFFGWRNMSVIHENYHCNKNYLSFEDMGVILPFGLKSWKHQHVVEPHRLGSIITDKVHIDDKGNSKRFFIYPIMLFPVIIRKITYKIWFYFLEGKFWTSNKRSFDEN